MIGEATCAVPVMEVLALWGCRAGGDLKPPQAAPVKSRGGERCGKGPTGSGQVCDGKTNVCEPLLTHRNNRDGIETGVASGPRESAAPWGVSWARRRPVCCPGGVR